jgi:hypothetical protein
MWGATVAVSLQLSAGRFVVEEVRQKAQGKLSLGDEVLKIDGLPLHGGMTQEEAEEMLAGPDGSLVELEVRTAKGTLSVVEVLRERRVMTWQDIEAVNVNGQDTKSPGKNMGGEGQQNATDSSRVVDDAVKRYVFKCTCVLRILLCAYIKRICTYLCIKRICTYLCVYQEDMHIFVRVLRHNMRDMLLYAYQGKRQGISLCVYHVFCVFCRIAMHECVLSNSSQLSCAIYVPACKLDFECCLHTSACKNRSSLQKALQGALAATQTLTHSCI